MKFYGIIFFLLITISCKEKQKQEQAAIVPECLLSEQEMIDMMVDLSLVKAAKSLGRKELKESGIKPLGYLFVKHAVDTIVIRENLEYYNSDLKKSKQLYDSVTSVLKRREEVLRVVLDTLESKKKDKEAIENQKDDLEEEESNDD